METAPSSNALDVSSRTEDMKYLQALTVSVSNFVSVKLSGRSNYKIWKAQMLCLIKSQMLLHFIDAKNPFPGDKGVHMIEQYDELVKGWIFGSVNEIVLKDLIDLGTAQEVWMKLESLFNSPISDTEGPSSNALDVPALDVIATAVSAIREDLKYMVASNVKVSDFVSLKLSGETNYRIWKSEMLNLIRSHELLHIIHDKNGFPEDADPMIQKYNNLVKGWILSTITKNLLQDFQYHRSAYFLWRNIKSGFEYGYSRDLEIQKYKRASAVNVSDFVSQKVYIRSKYMTWKAQMLSLIESQDLLYLLRVSGSALEDKCDNVIQDWIFDTISDRLMKDFTRPYRSAKHLWKALESRFTDGDIFQVPVVSLGEENLKYMQASNVCVSNFVSVKLSGPNNYEIWKTQMLFLIQSQKLLHVINDKSRLFDDKYDTLVKGWIFGTMNDQLLAAFSSFENENSKEIWKKLESTFNRQESNRDSEGVTSPAGFIIFRTESVRPIPEIEDTDNSRQKKELYEAAIEGCWWKAKSILNINKNATIEAIAENGNTILHIAVEMGHNYFVEKLLEFIDDGKSTETQNSTGQTALHIAALVGNKHAAQLLITKRKELLEIRDHNQVSPFLIASANRKHNIFASLFKSTPTSDTRTYDSYTSVAYIIAAMLSKEYDLVETLLKNFTDFASRSEDILMTIVITFPTDLGFMESFIYPSFHNVRHKIIVRGSLLFNKKISDKCVDDILRVVTIGNYTCYSWLGKNSMILILLVSIATLYQIVCLLILVFRLPFSMLYFLLWKVLAVTVRPIKNIEKKKKDYKEAKRILSLVCDQMGTSNSGYMSPLFEAVRQDIYEVVDEILFTSPATINFKDKEGYNIIQLSIRNRAEKVYNLISHITERTKYHAQMTDPSYNHLGHLVGRLAPSFVLERTTGAALQLQRELLWREEVEKLLLPLINKKVNIHSETPAMVFTREHQDLLKEGELWMKTTAESCSITAALIVTVVFAAAITVPGGNQDSGIPLFKKEISFTIFAISNAFSLFTAATALLLFLSILTARFSEKDFLVSLPRRLILGLLTLFLSTIAMMIAFGAILFLVFCDQRPWMLVPICAFACLPISVIVGIKLPLLADLVQSTYSPIFGKKSYLESCKVSPKNTIFMHGI